MNDWGLKTRWYKIRWYIRKNPLVKFVVYMGPNMFFAMFPPKLPKISTTAFMPHGRVALCLRFRNEAPFLEEWIEYHLAAGVDHFFLYNNFSSDNYKQVLCPYVERGRVTLIDWPYKPASPAAENDCIARTRGRFDWVGFLDADEFVVIRDGRSIPEFLAGFTDVPAVALFWYIYGSSGHKARPRDWVINAYKRRSARLNVHFKVFVRPDQVTRNKNSHNFYYRGARCAVQEDGKKVFGSLSLVPTARNAWINHYYYKSLEDYMEKANSPSALDRMGIKNPTRRKELSQQAMREANEIVDDCACKYYKSRKSNIAIDQPD